MAAVEPRYFRAPASFRAWLSKHHETEAELWIGFYKKSSGRGGMIYKQALDEALCFGWIDGIVKSIDGERYMQRFTPRKRDSHWSLVNVRRFGELDAAGLVEPAGHAAFGRRTPGRTGKASYESAPAEFTPSQKKALRAHAGAAAFFDAQPPGYKRVVKHFVTSAKQEATRERRMKLLVECCARGERIPQFISPAGKK